MPQKRDQRAANADWYRRNRDQEIFRVRVRQDGTREMLREWRQVPCADCGGRFEPHQMDFDHRDPSTKSFNLMSGRSMLMSTAKLRAEAAKCDVVCANCHAVRTQKKWQQARPIGMSRYIDRKRRNWRAHAAALLELRRSPCPDCLGTFSPYSMEFDHRDPADKHADVTQMVGRAGLKRIMVEAAKCDVVCANCHRMRTFVRREARISSGSSSTVERELSKLDDAGSNPVSRSTHS